MEYSKAVLIYNAITKTPIKNEPDYLELLEDFKNYAIKYAEMRVDWYMADIQKRIEIDKRRTSLHNALIANVNSLARYMESRGQDISWRTEMGDDRKEIGDFACYYHCFMGIAAR
ncbi:MAG TPA: hypothetical protein GX017_04220 [Clostridiales bacterium]|jgi:hypothetical protein|nr:hypothetical protein [Clostridiales bacterium]